MHKLAVLSAIVGLLGGCSTRLPGGGGDGEPACSSGEKLVHGECRFVCTRDGECATGERCDLILGQCEPKPAAVDAGLAVGTCTTGAVRCSTDNKAVQRCQSDGGFELESTCPSPNGFCDNGQCLACRPGSSLCTSASTVDVCDDRGSAFTPFTCLAGASCTNNECQACTTGATRCTSDGASFQECQRQNNPASSTAWVNAGDNFDGACITQQCVAGPNGAACRAPDCVPGATQCKDAKTAQLCSATGAYQNTDCSALGPTSECVGGICIDECADAVAAKSYFGCEYWAVNLDNAVNAFFKGRTLSGQGTVDSDFVFVVTNQSSAPATVLVQRVMGGNVVTVKTVTVPGRTDAATKGLVKIPVPWQAMTAANDSTLGVSGVGRLAYHLVSTKPITVYQFNPIEAIRYTKGCSTPSAPGALDCSCNELFGYPTFCSLGDGTAETVGSCRATASGNKCAYQTFSNDASLLLPSHILGKTYVATAPGSVRVQSTTFPGQVVIVAGQDSTVVTVKAAGPVIAGAGIAAMAAGESRDITLNSYDVLQLTAASLSTSGCVNRNGTRCRVDGDLTGTVILSDKPVAVFGGNACSFTPYDRQACDHVEEQLFPFETWGKTFAITPAAPVRLANGGVSGIPPSTYKVVAGCPASQCPTGTLLTLNPAPAQGDVTLNGCEAGTSIGANNCRLMGTKFVEFRASRAFTLTADQPVAVAQFLNGIEVIANATEGDPSMIMMPPAEQWRSRYTVLASTGFLDNFLGLTIDSARVSAVLVDGVAIGGFAAIGTSTYRYVNHPVTVGTHTIQVNSLPGQSTIPGAGVVIYGYDESVSYGYTGGLDLSTLVTGTNPGG